MNRTVAAFGLVVVFFATGCRHEEAIAGSTPKTPGDTHVIAQGSSLSREKRKREDADPDTVRPSMQNSGGNKQPLDSSSY